MAGLAPQSGPIGQTVDAEAWAKQGRAAEDDALDVRCITAEKCCSARSFILDRNSALKKNVSHAARTRPK